MSLAAMAKTHFQDTFLPHCLIVLIFLQLLPSNICRKADFTVFGPNDPILAIVGEDTELLCHVNLNISIENMELRWYRDQPSPAVYVYKKGNDTHEEQMEEYRARTTFVGDDVAKGKAAVRIHNVTALDNGTYHCCFRDGKAFSEATLWLKVAGLGAEPRIRLRDDTDKGIQAECTSAGWYPEPQAVWTDSRGNTLPSEGRISASASSGLFAVASNVTVRDSAVEGLRCSISNPLLPERKVAEIQLPDSFSRKSQSTVWKIVLPLMLIALGLVITGVICVFWKRQKEKNRRLLEDESKLSRLQASHQPPNEQLQEELS
ncbi:butyrophilin-like protein 10 isoform X2 [Dasypus novemcinctus]|uniref:butyrophilin-like protein 10 isoform X2 n=1 Tax=Dasypus novemcinctus TaxID=9361 RepID=UPI0003CC01AE|nr:butyrophilin-like protein 10 isoform X2 [Dasypus novemcinctus]